MVQCATFLQWPSELGSAGSCPSRCTHWPLSVQFSTQRATSSAAIALLCKQPCNPVTVISAP
eukprot:7471250-Lingulodinium_polyedra.AAC.1